MTMEELYKNYPDPDDILSLEPEKLAEIVLSILKGRDEEAFCLHGCINEIPFTGERRYGEGGYPQARKYEISLAVSEAFACLRTQTLIVEKPEYSSGIWLVLSRRARSMKVSSERTDPGPDRKRRRPAKDRPTKPGYVNRNDQKVIRRTNLRGHLNQWVYHMKCLRCDHNYGANGFDCHLRKCPECSGGRPGLPYE